MAVVSYAHVIFNPEFGTGALNDHLYWGLMLLVIVVYGPGRLSLDYMLARFSRTQSAVDSDASAANA